MSKIATFWNQHRENLAFIVTLLVVCWPVGLYLLWKYPGWTSKTKLKAVIGAIGVIVAFGIVSTILVGVIAPHKMTQQTQTHNKGKKTYSGPSPYAGLELNEALKKAYKDGAANPLGLDEGTMSNMRELGKAESQAYKRGAANPLGLP